MSGVPVLQTVGLEKRFGGVHAIAGVDFSLAEGELRCLIGPNGAGKSTFFKMVTGQIAPTAGRIVFAGTDITRAAAHEIGRLGIGIKNQVPDVFDGLTVRENLWLAARRGNAIAATRQIIDDLMQRLQLGDIAQRLVGELAHGQRQWVEIGMVLARRPRLVLLDEPSAGMSAEETSRTAALIREVNKTTTMIVVEHDMQFIRQIATKVTVFHQGRILVEDIFDRIMANAAVRDVYLGRQAAA
ncbi:MAG TPA: ATP-binding cassette domain-containing protein [Dongiaceae bacterium]